MAIEKLSVILELVTGNYKKEARDAATATGMIGSSAKSVTGQLGLMLGPAAIGGAILGLGKMALAAGENADRLFDLQAQTGLSTEALQEWEFVAKAAGATTEVFAEAVKAVIRNLSPTEGATGAAAKAYEALGISVFDAGGKLKDAGVITEEAFTKLAAMEDITARNALAQDLFGKKWEETITVLDLGTVALGNLREEGQKGVISAQALAQSDKFRETWQKFTATLGPKLQEMLGRISPLLTDVAEAAMEVVEELQPLFDAIGFLTENYDALKTKGEELAASENDLVATWGRMIGETTILNVVTGDYMALVEAGIPPIVELGEAVGETGGEIHDSWNQTAVAAEILRASLGPTIAMLDRQNTSHRNVAKAADTQRTALINLAEYQASQLTPISNIIRLQQELATAQEALKVAQADGKTPADELALAQLGVAEALLAVQGAGLALNPDEIQAFAQLLVTQFGYSEKAALDTLEALNLLDGWTGTATFTLKMNDNVAGGGGVNPLRDVFQFDTGGVVPGARGSAQLILAHGGETILPTHKGGSVGGSTTIVVQSPMGDFRSDLQYATILASVTNLVEGF